MKNDHLILIFQDNFEKIPVGHFSAGVGPLTEYHILSEAAPKFGWSLACFYHDGSENSWRVDEIDGRKVMCQTFTNDKSFTHPILAAGDPMWSDYELDVELVPLAKGGRCGVIVRYETNRRYLFFGLDDRGIVLLRICEETSFHVPDETLLVSVPIEWEAQHSYHLHVNVAGSRIEGNVEGLGRLVAEDGGFHFGKIGLTSDIPAQYLRVQVNSSTTAVSEAETRIAMRVGEQERLQAENPKPLLWKKIATPGFGVGRNLRFGDLNGDGKMEILVPQVIQYGPRDAYAEVGCLTAIDLDGNILWRHGKPDPANWFLTNDVAVQVHDIDGDGAAEVIYCQDFEIRIVDGATGRIKKSAPTPFSRGAGLKYERILGDCLCFGDIRGLGRAGDLIIKDRYWNFWVYDQNLNPLWDAACRTGHYPWVGDIDHDGRDEIAMGYALFDHDGSLLWNLEDSLGEHADGVAVVNFQHPGTGQPRVIYAASDDGVIFLDLHGNILRHHHIGHAQNPAVLKLRPDLPGLQTVTVNFWGNQGILNFFDADGKRYHTCEPVNWGSMCLPVNWRGDGVEYFLHSTHPVFGGLFDGWGRAVVTFPNDGHPDLCSAVINLTSDCRDEIVTWNPQEIWIYTQNDAPKDGRLYKPVRSPLYNSSNYQASVSVPGWTE